MTDVSGYGFRLNIVASVTFPAGFDVTQFADDADPFDTPELKVAEMKLGLNGDPITWSVATAVEIKTAVVPGSDDDANLGILLEANRVGAGKASVMDEITVTAIYPDGTQKQLSSGRIVTGMIAKSVSSAGRLKSRPYSFMFGNVAGDP